LGRVGDGGARRYIHEKDVKQRPDMVVPTEKPLSLFFSSVVVFGRWGGDLAT
jgi:hypothetical protein